LGRDAILGLARLATAPLGARNVIVLDVVVHEAG
jgi:hypothetical protein